MHRREGCSCTLKGSLRFNGAIFKASRPNTIYALAPTRYKINSLELRNGLLFQYPPWERKEVKWG